MNSEAKLKILVVDDNRGRSAVVERALSEHGHAVMTIQNCDSGLSKQVAEIGPDVIIMDLESPSRDTLEQMRTISRDNPKPVVMFAEDNNSNSIREAIEAGVSAYVVDGLSDKRVKPLIDVAIARFKEYQSLRDELNQVKNSLEERKLVDRAKGILMKRKQCSEEEAYQLLRRSAMQSNQRIGEVARNLISSVELLGD